MARRELFAVYDVALTGRAYNNRFVSIITVKDTKVVHWRDYLDPITVFEATGWPGTLSLNLGE
jgi:uncharacterized protein